MLPSERTLVWAELSAAVALVAGLIMLHSPHDVIDAVAVSPGRKKSIFVISRNNLLRSAQGGGWKRLTTGLAGRSLSSLVLSPRFDADRTLFVASLGGGVFRSRDEGLTWTPCSQGLGERHIILLGIAPDFPDSRALFALGRTGRIYRSTDAGDSWTTVWTARPRRRRDSTEPDDAADSLIDALHDAGDTWTNVHRIDGPNCMAFASDAVVVGTSEGALCVSQDRGESWLHFARAPAGARITCVEIPPGRGLNDPFFVGTDSLGVLRVTARGKVISPCKGPKSLLRVTALGSFTDPSGRLVLFACSWTDALFVSSDDGASWTLAGDGLTRHPQADEPRFNEPHFRALAAVPAGSAEEIYVGGFDGLFRRRSGASAWEPVETLPLGIVLGVAISAPVGAAGSSIAVATYGAGAYLRSAEASSWTILNGRLKTLRLGPICFSPQWERDRTLFSVSEACVLRSTGEGPWAASYLRPSGVQSRSGVGLVVRLRKAERMLSKHLSNRWMRTLKRFYRTVSVRVTGRTSRYVFPTVLVFSRNYAEDETLFVGTRGHGIFRSRDAGRSFTPVWDTAGRYVTALDLSSGTEFKLFAALSDGLYRSDDHGATWSRISADARFRELRIGVSPNFETDGSIFCGGSTGVLRSRDGGKLWESLQVDAALGDHAVGGLALSPDYGSDRSLLVHLHGRGLYRSMDGGDSFEKLPWEVPASDHAFTPLVGFPDSNTLFQFSPNFAADRTIVAAAYDQVYLSRDWGLTWTVVSRPTRYESSRPEITYRGRWTLAEHAAFSAETAHHSRVSQDTASLRFVGTRVTWIGTRGPDHGVADVLIDGTLSATVDLFAPVHEFSVSLYSIVLAPGEHEISLRISGSRNENASDSEVWIDAFDVA